jgi:hypothetical protein
VGEPNERQGVGPLGGTRFRSFLTCSPWHKNEASKSRGHPWVTIFIACNLANHATSRASGRPYRHVVPGPQTGPPVAMRLWTRRITSRMPPTRRQGAEGEPPRHKEDQRHIKFSRGRRPRHSDPENWAAAAPRKEGSWWPEWTAWLEKRSGAPVKAARHGSSSERFCSPLRRTWHLCIAGVTHVWIERNLGRKSRPGGRSSE